MLRTLITAALFFSAPAGAADAPVTVDAAWIRLMPGGAPSAGYCTLRNRGDDALRLVDARSPAFGRVMLHRTVEREGTSRMQHVDGADIPPGGSLALAPGGYHLMLMQPRRELQEGGRVDITLQLSGGASIEASFVLRPPHARGAD